MPTFRSLRNLRYRLFYGALLRKGYPLLELGNRATGCSWSFCPKDLDARSVIYGGGVGRDITFEHALVKRLGCNVVLFDPSPTGAETMSLAENQIPQFRFNPVALAGHCGKITFAPPQDQAEGSWFTQKGNGASLEVPCVDLATLMRQNGHDHIDLIKLDIEGAEYEVIDHLLKNRLRIRQILVEFHHQMLPGIRRSQTIRSMLKLVATGYRLLRQDGNNHTFLRPPF